MGQFYPSTRIPAAFGGQMLAQGKPLDPPKPPFEAAT